MSSFEPAIVVDPLTNPEGANEILRELTGPSASTPLMPPLPSDIVPLPGGYLDVEGNLHRECRIREINGSDEEAMARELRSPTVNVPRVVDLVLKRCVLGIGTIESTPQALANMLIGDRAALMMAVRILTFGNDWEVPDFPCRLCGETFGTIVELNTIGTKKLDNPMVQEVEVELRNGSIANLGLITGEVQLEMVGDANRTGPEEVTIAIDRCIRRMDGRPVGGSGVAQRMSMADRRKIAKVMTDAQPGPRMEEVVVACEKCGREADYALSLVDIFR